MGSIIGVTEGDTRSVDYSSHGLLSCSTCHAALHCMVHKVRPFVSMRRRQLQRLLYL